MFKKLAGWHPMQKSYPRFLFHGGIATYDTWRIVPAGTVGTVGTGTGTVLQFQFQYESERGTVFQYQFQLETETGTVFQFQYRHWLELGTVFQFQFQVGTKSERFNSSSTNSFFVPELLKLFFFKLELNDFNVF